MTIKGRFLLLLFLLLSLHLAAQDSTATKRADSAVVNNQKKLLAKSDSARHALDSLKDKAGQLSKKVNSKLNPSIPDSLNPNKKLQQGTAEVNLKLKSMTHVDSLLVFNHELKKVDSLKQAFQKKASEIQSKAGRKQKQIKKSMDSLQGKYNSQVKEITKKFSLNNKNQLAGHEKELAGKLDLNAPVASKVFPHLAINSSLPGSSINTSASLPSLPALNGSSGNGGLPNVNSGVPNISQNAPNLNANALKDLQQGPAELKKLEKEGSEYTQQLQQLKKDSLANIKQGEKWTEDQIQGRSEIKALKDKQLEIEKQQKAQQEYLKKVAEYQNPKRIEEEIKRNAAKVVSSDLLTKQPQFQDAQKTMSKAKKKYGEYQSIKDLPKRPLNPMKELSFRERFYPGIFFQVLNGKFYSIDLAPQAYYKITTRLDVGAGLIYRLNVDFSKPSLVQNHDLFGFKIFSDFKIYKSFYFRAEAERVNWQVAILTNADVTNFRWTNTLLGGLGKEFNISKKLQANTLILYNALDSYDSPYSSKFLFRFGINLSLKKDQRREFIKSLQQ